MTLEEACESLSLVRPSDQKMWVDLTGDFIMLNMLVDGRLVCFWVYGNTAKFEDWEGLNANPRP